MRKYFFSALVCVFVLAAMMSPVIAGKHGPKGKSNVAHLYLYEKDPDTWGIVEDGAWGKMKYNLSGPTFDFVFNGHGLEANIDYSLIYYPEPQTTWPWPVTVIASGSSNGGGNIHLENSYEFDADLNDAKIWLVLSEDLNADDELAGWNPTEYLFEHNLITYTDE